MKKAFIVIALLTIFLASCQSSDLPPEPGTPGQGEAESDAKTGSAFEQAAEGYAPPYDVFDANTQIFFVERKDQNDGDSISLVSIVEQDRGFIYKKGFFYSVQRKQWIPYYFPQETIRGSNWIRENAEQTITISKEEIAPGENYIVSYSCKKYDGEWKCGCRSENDCGYWMLQTFVYSDLPPEPTEPNDTIDLYDLSVATIKDEYQSGERIELTDPPEYRSASGKPVSKSKNIGEIIENAALSPQDTSVMLNFDDESQESAEDLGYIIEFNEDPLIVQGVELRKETADKSIIKKRVTLQSLKLVNVHESIKQEIERKLDASLIEDEQDSNKITAKAVYKFPGKGFLAKLLSKIGITGWAVKSPSRQIKVLGEYEKVFNGISLKITSEEAEKIKEVRGVKNVQPNRKVTAFLQDSVPLIQADQVWERDRNDALCSETGQDCLTGKGTTIAVLDTGVDYTHADLGGSMLPSDRNFTIIGDSYVQGFFYEVDDLISLDEESIAYFSGNNISIFSFGNTQIATITLNEDVSVKKIAYKGDRIAYFAMNNSDTHAVLSYYDIQSGIHTNILSSDDMTVGSIDIEGSKIVYGLSTMRGKIEDRGIYAYDIDSKVTKRVTDNAIMFRASGNKVAYQISSGVCYDKIVVHDLETESNLEITDAQTQDIGPVLDFEGDEILYADCSKTNFNERWNRYHLYTLSSGESMPLAGEEDSEKEVSSAYFSSVYWMNKGQIANNAIFLSLDINANRIVAYDRIQKRYSQINVYQDSGSMDARGNRVCFITSRYRLYCHDYNPANDYSVIPVEFNSKVIGGFDFVNNDNEPLDDHGHGTHVAATAAGKGDYNGNNVYEPDLGESWGVAPDARILAYKVLDSKGSGSTAEIISAIERAVDPNNDKNFEDKADIISMSLGGEGNPDDAMSKAIDNAVNSGVVAVIAAGNDGPWTQTIASPGTARKAITIGASNKIKEIAKFSSRGPIVLIVEDNPNFMYKPDIVAPGVQICAAQSFQDMIGDTYEMRYNSDVHCIDNKHISISGTSMATPHVAGVAALLKQKNPHWSPEEIKSALKSSSEKLPKESILGQGNGIVRALSAMGIAHPVVSNIERVNLDSIYLTIYGSAYGGDFARYQISFRAHNESGTDEENWQVLGTFTNSVASGTLYQERLNEFNLVTGLYDIRLTVFNRNGDEFISEGMAKIVKDIRFSHVRNIGYANRIGLGDLDKDGQDDFIIVQSGHLEVAPKVYAISQNGSNLPGWPQEVDYWSFFGQKIILAHPVVVDIDRDGDIEIVLVAGAWLYAWEGGGTPVSGFPVSLKDAIGPSAAGSFTEHIGLSVQDLNRDGSYEIIVTSRERLKLEEQTGPSAIFVFDEHGNLLKSIPINGIVNWLAAVGDLDSDGKNEIAVTAFACEDNEGCSISYGSPLIVLDDQLNKVQEMRNEDLIILSSPSISDMDNDGSREIVVPAFNISSKEWQWMILANGDVEYQQKFIEGPVWDLPVSALGDPDDGVGSVLTDGREVYILNKEEEPKKAYLPDRYAASSPVIFPSENGQKRIIVGGLGSLFMYDSDLGLTGTFETDNFVGPNLYPMIKDIDDDGDLDLVSADIFGGIFVWRDISASEDKSEWPQVHHDALHTGCYDCSIDLRPQSKLVNNADREVIGHLTISIEKEGSLIQTPIDQQIVIPPKGVIKLDKMFNPLDIRLNAGAYNIVAEFTDENGKRESATWTFTVI